MGNVLRKEVNGDAIAQVLDKNESARFRRDPIL
jgi:hypothetical protein